MTTEVAKAALDFFLAQSAENQTCSVFFNGGEPSLNFDAVKLCVNYGSDIFGHSGKNLAFYFVTNGLKLEREMVDFLAANQVTIVIGIDGPWEIHNRFRQQPDGSGSYEAVVDSIRLIRSNPDSRLAAISVVASAEENVVEIVSHIHSLGIDNVVLKPVIELGQKASDRGRGLEAVVSGIAQLSLEALENVRHGAPSRNRYFVNENIVETYVALIWRKTKKLLPVADRSGRCAAGLDELGIMATGDIYPCVFFAGLEDYRLGNVANGIDREKLNAFISEADLSRMTLCHGCWARYICSGGCLRDSVGFSGFVNRPNQRKCEVNKELIKLSLYIVAAIMEEDESLIQHFVSPLEYNVAQLCETFDPIP